MKKNKVTLGSYLFQSKKEVFVSLSEAKFLVILDVLSGKKLNKASTNLYQELSALFLDSEKLLKK